MNTSTAHTVHGHSKAERLEARISSKQKTFLQQAASIQGRSLTDFIITCAQDAAMRILQDYDVISLSAKDRDAFVSALLKPPRPSRRLIAAARRYKKLPDTTRSLQAVSGSLI